MSLNLELFESNPYTLLLLQRKVSHVKVAKEIPTPITLTVNTYALDYLPTFNEGNTYIRGKGGLGYDDPTFVEYDLDSEDFRWLCHINTDGQERLSAEKMEMMLWKLDLANAEATDKVFSFQGQCRTFVHSVLNSLGI